MARKSASPHRSPGRPVSTDGETMREQLLDATLALVGAQGVAATSIAQIAARVGVTAAMVHYYFKNREQLLDALVDERIAPAIARVWDPVTADAEPLAAVEGVVRRIAAAGRAMPELGSLWLREVTSDGGMLRERILRHLPTDKLRMLNESVARGQREGLIHPDIDARYVFVSVIGLIMLPLAISRLFSRLSNDTIAPDALEEHAVALLRHGLDKGAARRQRT